MPVSGQLPLAGMEPPVVAAPDRTDQAQVDTVFTAVDTSIARTGQADVAYVSTGQLLTKTTGFLAAYDFTLNPYSGCSFGCTYCYAAFFSRDAAKRTTGAIGSASKRTPSSCSKSADAPWTVSLSI